MNERLHPDDVERIAQRVVELLNGPPAPVPSRLLTAAEVAERYGVTRGWVYSNAEMLGAQRLGSGSKARMRFNALEVEQALASRTHSRRSQQPQGPMAAGDVPRRRTRAHAASARSVPDVPLLPVRGWDDER